MNIQWSKQPPYTWSCLWNLPFLVLFFNCWKSWVFVCFKLIFFWISRQNFSVEGDEVDIFSEGSCWKLLFFLKIIIKQKPCRPTRNIMHSLSTFIWVSGPMPEVKTICIDQWLWKHCCIFKANKCGLFQIHLGATPGKFGYFFFI